MTRTSKFAALLALLWIHGSVLAQDIIFTNRTATFTNLQGAVFKDATLVKADLDGLVWRSGISGGRICYTNLNGVFLESLGVPTNRIAIAKTRAEHKAVSDAQYRAARDAQAQLAEQARQAALADWAAGAPAREREAQRKVDLDAINTLSAQIKAEDNSLRHAEAAAFDYNANPNNAGYSYVNNAATRREAINDVEERLSQMRRDYAVKYGKER
jgi:hypothetical protein